MQAWHFSENAYPYLPDESTFDSIRVTLPNKYYDPRIGADLYHRYIDEWLTAEDLGIEIMANEHHQTATCVDPAVPIVMGILARETKTARLLILGNPIANRNQPVRVAEEMAMIDVISRGRLDLGFVRGVPYEISAGNISPTRMQERFWEAHDLIMKALTTHDGPFNFEGKYYHHRQVNIWPRPYQQPHPPIWITTLNPKSAPKIAERGYIAASFLTGFDITKEIYATYRARRAEINLPQLGLDRFAYAALIHTGETDELGYEGARKILWYLEANKVPPHFANPPGYSSVEANVKALRAHSLAGPQAHFGRTSVDEQIAKGILFAGNPDTVFNQIKKLYDYVGGFGHLLMMGQAGFLEHDETVRGMELFAKEVYPRLKELSRAEAPVAASSD